MNVLAATEKWTLKELSTGYLHLRLNDEIWAQWPKGEKGPKLEHCFHADFSWPIISKYLAL